MKQSDAEDTEDATESANPAQNKSANATVTNATLSNVTTTQTTTTPYVYRRPTTTTTIVTPAPADSTQVWMAKDEPCLVECKDSVERVFGRGPLPSSDSA